MNLGLAVTHIKKDQPTPPEHRITRNRAQQQIINRNSIPKANPPPSPLQKMSQSVSSTTANVSATDGIYDDVDRQLSRLTVKARTGGYTKSQCVAFNVWLGRGSPEGSTPAVKVDNATLGMVGKSIEKRRGLDVYQYNAGSEVISAVKLAIGVDAVSQPKLRELLRGSLKKLVEANDPIVKSRWFEKTFSETLNDGTKVFRGTTALLTPEEYLDMSFQEDAVWDSPSATFAPFMFGSDEEETKWYIKSKVSDDAQVYLYTNKKGYTEYAKTTEDGQVVYPKGGVPVKNTNMLKTLLASKLYRDKIWRAKCILKLTGITLKTAASGTTPDGSIVYSVYPVFSFTVPTAVVLVEHDPTNDEEGGLTDKQRDAATRAVLFEGMVSPKRKRKSRDNAVAPLFNAPSKKGKAGESDEDEFESDGEEA